MAAAAYIALNHSYWERTSDSYQQLHAQTMSTSDAGWGVWRLSEAELQVMGDVGANDVLEFGCGAAQWSICLARRGARPVGLDFSGRQLRHALRLQQECDVYFPLVQASAENVPLRAAAFDIVFCDWGAMTFADLERTEPEAARLLQPGGLFAFSTGSPLLFICWPAGAAEVSDRLQLDYFDQQRYTEESIDFSLTYGDWIRLFRRNGLLVEDLIEPRPPAGARSSYRTVENHAWSRRWPAELIWKLRKEE